MRDERTSFTIPERNRKPETGAVGTAQPFRFPVSSFEAMRDQRTSVTIETGAVGTAQPFWFLVSGFWF